MKHALLSAMHAAVPAMVVFILLVAPPFLSSFLLTLVTQALIYAIVAMSLDIILGYTGLASLGHAAYFGLGAYSVGILATRYGAGFGITLPAGVFLALAVAAIFCLVALRASGVYFLMITLALGMVVWGLASVIIGEALVGSHRIGLLITGAVMGSVLFRLLVAIALRWGLNPNDLKLITAGFVFVALIAPGLARKLKSTPKPSAA